MDNSSSPHTDNRENNILVLGEGRIQGINDSTGAAEKKSINFSKANTKCWLCLQSTGDDIYLYASKTDIYKFKAKDNISWYNFCSESMSLDFTKDEQIETSLNGIVYNISVSHSSVKKEDIFTIHQYLMIKNNIKRSLDLLCY